MDDKPEQVSSGNHNPVEPLERAAVELIAGGFTRVTNPKVTRRLAQQLLEAWGSNLGR